jgi:hypothetical protein
MSGAIASFMTSGVFHPLMIAVISSVAFKYGLGLSDNMEILRLAGIVFGSVFVSKIIEGQLAAMSSKQ